jgi:hypothetical protein
MNLLRNGRIATKITSIVLILVTLAVAQVFYLTAVLKDINARYADIVERESAAAITIIASNRQIVLLGYEAYKAIAYDGNSTEAKEADGRFRAAATAYDGFMKRSLDKLPEKTREL